MKLGKLFSNILCFLRASAVINNFPDGIIYVNSDGIITKINQKAREIFAFSENENTVSVNEYIFDGMHNINISAKQNRPVLVQVQVGGHKFSAELTAVKKRDSYLVSLRVKTEMTKEKDMQDKMSILNNEKNAMLLSLESDLKSPINSIMGFSKGLLDGIGGELTQKQVKYIKIIDNNANELNDYMNKLLEFSYCESSLYEQEFDKFDVVTYLKEITNEYEKTFEDKKIIFNFDYSALDERFIYTDKKAFKKIIENILRVSIGMTESGSISLNISPVDEQTAFSFGLEDENSYYQIALRDTGAGFESQEIKTVCDPYSQLDKGKKNLLRSLSLGSATILIKRSNGFIDISSELMRGTIYNIILPIKKEKYE